VRRGENLASTEIDNLTLLDAINPPNEIKAEMNEK
jgi:hypothetical protein